MLNEPLWMRPIFRDYLWGGDRLRRLLGKPAPEGIVAESWEVVDRGNDQSRVDGGPWDGWTLGQLREQHGPELLGRDAPRSSFPLLFKFLDAERVLSLQVHPNDQQAALLERPDLGKTEAWVILHAAPDAKLYAGLRPGIDRGELERLLAVGAPEQAMHVASPQAGDCYFLPAGVPHALGAGLMVAEIQQSSDTTFRLHDWGRVGADGKPRPLHISQALDVIDFEQGPVVAATPVPLGEPSAELLVECPSFRLIRRRLSGQAGKLVGGDQRCHIFAVIQGQVEFRHAAGRRLAKLGQTVLLPAAAGAVELLAADPQAVVLEMTIGCE